MKKIEAGLAQMGLSGDSAKLKLLDRYIKEIELWNPRYGLVNAEGEELEVRHILDSLAAVTLLQKINPSTVADIGSGAGLPGIPLAIFLPDVSFDLVERSGRRVNFLRNAVLALGLKNVHIKEIAMEELKDQYDVVTFRGFSPFNRELMVYLERIMTEQGKIIAYKGKLKQIREELSLLDQALQDAVEILNVEVPFLKEERHLVTLNLADSAGKF